MARNHEQGSDAFGASAAPNTDGQKPRRSYHNKTRTGCKTCKARHLRCDEGKPVCRRCVSTGRKCDGYPTTPSFSRPTTTWAQRRPVPAQPPSPNAVTDAALLRSRKSPDELRSYRFFREVSGPSLAGAVNSNFWLSEIPRLCQNDHAIWHAVVSLGSAHEAYLGGLPTTQRRSLQTLAHFNAAIRDLTGSRSDPGSWKTLTASIVFVCICALGGDREQARLHFRSGCNILLELDPRARPHNGSEATSSGDSKETGTQLPNGPVSLDSIRSVLTGLELVEAKLDARTTSEPPALRFPDDAYSAWESYTMPSVPPALGRHLTADNLTGAARAAESLFVNLIGSSMVRAKKLRDLYVEGGFEALRSAEPHHNAESHTQGFNELDRSITCFGAELNAQPGLRIRPTELKDLRRAYLFISVIHETNRLVLHPGHKTPDHNQRRIAVSSPQPAARWDAIPDVCKKLLDLVEEALGLESTVGCLRDGGPVSAATIINPLFYLVKVGTHRETRQRAVQLLLKPRLESLIDSQMSAHLACEVMKRETEATREYIEQPELATVMIDHPTSRGWDGDGDDREAIHSLARIFNYSMAFTAPRKAKFVLRTWKEWLECIPGTETHVSW